MMGIHGNDEKNEFFDSRDELSSVSDLGSDCIDGLELKRTSFEWVSGNLHYDVWMGTPESVSKRRDKFLKWMDLGSDLVRSETNDSVYFSSEIAFDIYRTTNMSGTVLRTSDFEGEFSSSRSSISSWTSNAVDLSRDGFSEENSICIIKNLDDGTEFIVDGLGQDGVRSTVRKVGSNHLFTLDEFQSYIGLSPSIQQFMGRGVIDASISVKTVGTVKRRGWLRRLGSMICVADRQQEGGPLEPGDFDARACGKAQRVRVRAHRKRPKELSALYIGQEFQAHKGSILTMKFSLDGRYLASGGEDGIVRVWQVMECVRTDDNEIPKSDPSCIYFTVNDSSEVSPVFVAKEKVDKLRMRKTQDSACVIFPPKTFQISEKPLHEFHGHSGNVLDLSWSRNKSLLSSSEDGTVRLWEVGCHRCLQVFSHSNYVTCVQFNPVDDSHFISGSIDGKVRIWSIPCCQVVDWMDIREMVTAVCYRPNGQGVIVGSMTGNCRIYDTSGHHLQLDAQLCLQGKKKSPSKRIISFQFFPSDPAKVMVISADSQIRILDGLDIICRYRSIRNSGSQICASFTSDGKHIISASEDSSVYVWNHDSLDGAMHSQAKSIRSSEHFFSCNTSVAIPWPGIRSETLASDEQVSRVSFGNSAGGCHSETAPSPTTFVSLSSPNSFLLSHEFFSEALPKGSATWPEEKLPALSSLSAPAICKSHYRLLKTSWQNAVASHAWGLVIVTASLDGRIRSFHNYGLPIRL